MDIATHHARIAGPIAYRSGTGHKQNIPIGPCLVEDTGGQSIEVIWGPNGQNSAKLPIEKARAARDHGQLVVLD